MKLHFYFARKFLLTFASVFFVFLGILLLIDIAEQIRKFDSAEIGFSQVLGLSLLNVPESLYRILPLITILSTIALFLALARSSELVVTRAAGRSAIRALVAPGVVSLLLGAVAVAVLNPIVAATIKEYEARANEYRHGEASTLSIAGEGLWLRQAGAEGQTVIHAKSSNSDGTRLRQVQFISFAAEGGVLRRIDAAEARLTEGAWALTDAKLWVLGDAQNPETNAETLVSFSLPSDLTREQIADSFGTPATIPVWELPAFVERLERAGFSALSHRVWLQTELAMPLLLLAMVLIGAGFTMRHARFGQTGIMVLSAILFGFALFFVRNFAQVLGENGQIPILLAAWAPPVAAICLSLGLILHLEDG